MRNLHYILSTKVGRVHLVSFINLCTNLLIVHIVNIVFRNQIMCFKDIFALEVIDMISGFLGQEIYLHDKCMEVAFQGKLCHSSVQRG